MSRETLLLLTVLTAACGGGGDAAGGDSAGAATTVAAESTPAAPAPAGPQQAPTRTVAIDTAAAAGERPLLRESYDYEAGGMRDPFRPLVTAASRGPELPDLRLVGVMYDVQNPANSMATFRETGNNQRYLVRPGDRIGRLQVVSVGARDVILRMNDFGTVREQTYSLRKEDETP